MSDAVCCLLLLLLLLFFVLCSIAINLVVEAN